MVTKLLRDRDSTLVAEYTAMKVMTYHAAPTTDNPIHNATPISAHAYGETDSRKAPTSNDSPLPVKSMSRKSHQSRALYFRVDIDL